MLMWSSVPIVALGLVIVSLTIQFSVEGRVRAAIDRTARALPTAAPVADTLALAETRVQLTELGFTVGPTTTLDERVHSMIGFRADGVIADSADPTDPRHPVTTGFLTGFEGGGLLATQRRRHLPVPAGDVAQVLPGAPIDELLAAHVRGCRLMEAAGNRRLPVHDDAGARGLILHELDRLAGRLRRMSWRDRITLVRSQRGVGAEGHLLTTDEPLPTPR